MKSVLAHRRSIALVLAIMLALLTLSFLFPVVTEGHSDPLRDAAPAVAGWRLDWQYSTGTMFKHASPTIADIDGDGYDEVLTGNYNGNFYCFDSHGNLRWVYGTGATIQSTPLAVDVNGDGKREIFFGSDNGWVYGLDWGGAPLSGWGWPKYTGDGYGQSVFSSPAAGDLDGDGDLEIAVGSWGRQIWAWHYQGSTVAGFPVNNHDSVWSSPAVADIDLDGRAEIIIGADSTGAEWWYPAGGLLWVLRGDGSVQPGFPKWIRQVIWSSPAIADLNLDGFPEIIVGTGHYYQQDVAQGDGYHVYAWDHLGNPVPGWPTNTADNVFSSPAVGDINGDGFVEVACASLDGWVYLWTHDGQLVWQRQKWAYSKLSSPVMADISGDGKPEVIIGDSWELVAWDPQGTLVLDQLLDGILWNTAAVSDIDRDGKVEVVIGSGAGGEGGTLYCFQAGTVSSGAMPWPMFRRNPSHNASFPHQEVPDFWSASQVQSQWYLAEGYTGSGFTEYVLVMNPLDHATRIQLRYLLPSGMSAVKMYDIAAHSRFTIPVNSVLQGTDVSIAAISNDAGLVVERAMYFDYQGKTGGTSVVGIDKPQTTWYLAEGYTGGAFDTYILLANPNQQSSAEVDVTYMTDTGPVSGGHYSLLPKSRTTIHVDDRLPASNVSTRVVSNIPIAVERAMYFVYAGSAGLIDGGHGAKAVSSPSLTSYMAEGYTAGWFDTWLLVQNPNADPATVVVTFMKPGGVTQDFSFVVGGNSRYTVAVDGIPGMEATEFSTRVASDLPVIAERAMYFNYNGLTGGHDVIGAPAPKPLWYLAEGYTGGSFDTYILLQNPGTSPASVRVDFLKSSGEVVSRTYTLGAQSRYTVQVDLLPELADAEFSTVVNSNSPIIVERAMYFSYSGLTGGHDTLGFAP